MSTHWNLAGGGADWLAALWHAPAEAPRASRCAAPVTRPPPPRQGAAQRVRHAASASHPPRQDPTTTQCLLLDERSVETRGGT